MFDELVHYLPLLRALLLVLVGFPAVYVLGRVLRQLLGRRMTAQAAVLLSKGVVYAGGTVLALAAMRELNFKLSALLGAAGIAGVAIGFASQTSLSNVISGLFLVWEGPFQMGDVLSVGGDSGVVHSINLLSTELRTFDNRLIRIPNETLIKTSFINVTRFPIRRMDLEIGVAYKEDIAKVMRVLQEVADHNPLCLDEPAPVIIFRGFGDSALQFLFGAWFAKQDYVALRNSLLTEIKERFDAEGIEIPFPHRTLYSGSATEPFPVKIVGPAEAAASQPDSVRS